MQAYTPATAQNRLAACEYWFNNDRTGKIEIPVSSTEEFLLTENLDVSSLHDGVNVLYMRFRDEEGLWSSIIEGMFYKIPINATAENHLAEYEYWFNNDYAGRVVAQAGNSKQYLIAGNIDVSSLPDGVNVLNIRFRDSNGLVSSTVSEMFFKAPRGINSDNTITAYTYWFDNKSDDAVTVTLTTPVPQYTLTPAIDMRQVAEGEHLLHFRFRDAQGLWSIVTTDTITKTPMPVDVSVTQGEGSLTANASGATFQWLDCDNNHAVIPGETDRTFTPAANGNYSVQVTQNGSRDTSSCYYVTTVGITDNLFGNDIIVYPNPTTGPVTIDPGDTHNFTLSIRDMAGRLIMKSDFKEPSSLVLYLNEPPGIYLLTITAPDQRSKTIRIIRK